MRAWTLPLLMILAGCAQHANFQSRDTWVTGPVFRPEGAGPHAAIVLLHACGGLQPNIVRDWPKFLVESGYVVLVVDTMGSRGYQDCGRMPDRFEAQARDAYGALDWLAKQPFVDARRIAAVGFSLGAITINELIVMRPPRPAGNPEFRAFASFYGRCSNMNAALVRDVPLLQIVPEKDNFAPACIRRAKTVRMETHVLAGAFHAFDHPGMIPGREDPAGGWMRYDPHATARAGVLLRDFLAKHLK